MTNHTASNHEHDELVHQALFYSSDDEYIAGLRNFLEPGFAAGEGAVIAVPAWKHELIEKYFEGAPIRMIDMVGLGNNPGCIIPAVHSMFEEQAGKPLNYVGEPIWPGRSDEEVREATRHEWLINLAFEGLPVRVLCPYDVVGLDPEVIEDAAKTHPQLVDATGERPSDQYTNMRIPLKYDQPLAPAPNGASTLDFDRTTLGKVRKVVLDSAVEAGLSEAQASRMVLAVHELAINTISHGGGSGALSIWNTDSNITFEVGDSGWITDPLAGRRPPAFGSDAGRGLWLVNQLSDLVETRTGEAGTTIRLHARIQ